MSKPPKKKASKVLTKAQRLWVNAPMKRKKDKTTSVPRIDRMGLSLYEKNKQ